MLGPARHVFTENSVRVMREHCVRFSCVRCANPLRRENPKFEANQFTNHRGTNHDAIGLYTIVRDDRAYTFLLTETVYEAGHRLRYGEGGRLESETLFGGDLHGMGRSGENDD